METTYMLVHSLRQFSLKQTLRSSPSILLSLNTPPLESPIRSNMLKTTTKATLLCFVLAALVLMDQTSSTATYNPTSSAPTDTYIFAKCSPDKFSPGSAYETNLKSLLSSLVSSTVASRYINLTVGVKPEPAATVYGLFQCSVDLDATSCSSCISRAISLVGSTCPNSYSVFLQMQSCLVRFDKNSFFGVQDKTEMLQKCGQPLGFNDQDALTRVSDVMGSLRSGSGPDRTGGNGDVQGVAQCMGDLSSAQCQDCLTDAIGRLRSDCGMSQGGYVYLSKCYARFSYGGSHARQTPNSNFAGEGKDDKDNGGIGKTLAIIIGIITLVILLVVFLAFIGKLLRKLQDEKCCK
ncbi:plasmodesmata-located protein 5 isoform X1 [Raphanus sativus]|uniref:Plasmodesmata-located protein 5 isoform X1 n=1 Tax=Raphanus sativus TaxID=3726 RepID=A0A9W3CJ32_RAPSA|nr:plasmodesmata-located protein 5 isoform X1 [Raphanus sativus]